MTEADLRNEIARRAPHLKVLTVGTLFGREDLDAVVEDRYGQFLWSVYQRQVKEPAPAARPLPGQLSLF
jgi:hypothetical protein